MVKLCPPFTTTSLCPPPQPSSHCCLRPWAMHIRSLANHFTFFYPVPAPTILPSDLCQSVPCIHAPESILFASLFYTLKYILRGLLTFFYFIEKCPALFLEKKKRKKKTSWRKMKSARCVQSENFLELVWVIHLNNLFSLVKGLTRFIFGNSYNHILSASQN